MTRCDIKIALTNARLVEAERNGIASYGATPVTNMTVRNYQFLSAVNDERKVVKKVQQKTTQRFAAENSVLSTVAYLFTIATTHLIISSDDPSHSYQQSTGTMTKGARELLKLVSLANDGAPIKPVLPALITSTDDTTVFVFKGSSKEPEGWYLVENERDGKDQSNFSNDDGGTDNKNGLRVRLTFTMNGVGMMAAPFVTVTGLTERELPRETCPSGVFIISIPGLCAGGNSDIRNISPGFVCFVRSERCEISGKTAEKKNFEWYREHVLLPFVSDCRTKLYGRWLVCRSR